MLVWQWEFCTVVEMISSWRDISVNVFHYGTNDAVFGAEHDLETHHSMNVQNFLLFG